MHDKIALPYCKPCREASALGEMPSIPSHVRPSKPSAVRGCVLCGERCFDPVAAGRCAPRPSTASMLEPEPGALTGRDEDDAHDAVESDPAMPCCGRRESQPHTAECPSALAQDHDLYQFTRRQLATILAALRSWQRDLEGEALATIDPDFLAIAADGGKALDATEIDELCEILNFPPARYVEHHDDDCPEGCQSDACMHYDMNPPDEPRRAVAGARG